MSNYINSFQNPVVKGTINPLKLVTHKIALNFDSRFRDNYGSDADNGASFNYSLPETIDDAVSIRLKNIVVPSGEGEATLINGVNNSYTIGATSSSVTEGTYDHDGLVTAFNAAAAAAVGVNITVSRVGSRTTIANSGTEVVINFYDAKTCTHFSNTFAWLLGFRKGSYTIPNGATITSEGFFHGSDYLYFSVDDFQRNRVNNNVVYFNDSTGNDNILGKVYKDSRNYTLNHLQDSGETNNARRYLGPVKLSKFKFSLLDKFGNIANLNSMDYSFTLEVEVLYDRNNVTIPG